MLAKFSRLLIHRLDSRKCVVAGTYVCSDILFFIDRISKRKIRVEKIELELIMSDIAIGRVLSS